MSIDLREVKQYGKLSFFAKQAVEGFLIGLHKSPYKGFSVEFAEHKSYIAGESTRHIDWKLYGRTDKLYTKEYDEETNLRCYIVIDSSSSMRFGNKNFSKLDFSAIISSTLIQLLNKQRDAIGIYTIDEEITYKSEVKSSPKHANLLINYLESLLNKKSDNISTNLVESLHQIAQQIHKRSLVIIFSDLIDRNNSPEELIDALNHIKYSNNEVIIFQPMDVAQEMDLDLENKPHELTDIETGKKIKISPNEIRESYKKNSYNWMNKIKDLSAKFKLELIQVDINQNIDQILLPFLIKRSKMK